MTEGSPDLALASSTPGDKAVDPSTSQSSRRRRQPKPKLNPLISKIEDGLYLGDSDASIDLDLLKEHKVGALVSVIDWRWVHWGCSWYHEVIPKGRQIYIPAYDNKTQDLLPHFVTICDFIDDCRRNNISVLVHCEKGISRSATAMIAYLMRTHKTDLDEVLESIKQKRKVKPNLNFMEQLVVWGKVDYVIWEDPNAEDLIPKAEYAAYLAIRAERLKEAGLTGNEPVGIQNL
jgi:hypothetical protein